MRENIPNRILATTDHQPLYSYIFDRTSTSTLPFELYHREAMGLQEGHSLSTSRFTAHSNARRVE